MYRPFLNGRRGYRLLCVKIQSIDKHDLPIMRSLYSIVQRTLSVLKVVRAFTRIRTIDFIMRAARVCARSLYESRPSGSASGLQLL